ncbi:uncharacterized protein LOC62_07G009801 [Vanrija pseudolonga]|uniref:Uncharacterized protein n=1 Tax=Vanrija pseudolonga TaxID=143232 RepID=A0AAF0YMM3_9TREE|nr:hypothetical protein LOC62_07G009801 [Vanrija pseudolonga]
MTPNSTTLSPTSSRTQLMSEQLETYAQPSWYGRHMCGEIPADIEHLATLVDEGHQPVDAALMLRYNSNDLKLARQALQHVEHEKLGQKFQPSWCSVCGVREKEATLATSAYGTILRGGGVAAGVSSLVVSASAY